VIRPLRDRIIKHPDMLGMEQGVMNPVPSSIEPLFVYGTLQPGYGLFAHLYDYVVRFVADARAEGFEMYAHGYPIAVRTDEESFIWGTLLYLDKGAMILQRTDGIEIPAGFRRTMEVISTPYGTVDAWLYEYMGSPYGDKVEDGDFLSRRHNTRQYRGTMFSEHG